MLTKQCPECEQEKPLTDFYKTRSQCKQCVSSSNSKEYRSDIGTSRLTEKVRRETDIKLAIRKVKAFLERYQN